MKLNVNGADGAVNDRSQEPAVVGAAGRAGPARDEVRLRIGYCAVRTVLIDGRNTKSCQTPAERAVGTAVTTVEVRRRRLDRDSL